MPISRPKISLTYPKVRYLYWNLGIWKGKRVSRGRLESFLVRCLVLINFNFVQISNYSKYLFK